LKVDIGRPFRTSEKFREHPAKQGSNGSREIKIRRRVTMIDKVVKSADVGSVDLPFPGYTGDIKIKPLNGDFALGPSIIHIRMEPGATIPPHLHKKAAEVLCILDGDFINENKAYGSGDFLHSKPGTVHGPHTTKKGCSLLALYTANTGEADPSDFFLADSAKRS
jgi:quercetin dioxygenase-like cupin family protein